MAPRIPDMNTAELLETVQAGTLEEGEVLEVLRNPYCTIEIAERIAASSTWLSSQTVRERLTGFRGLPLSRAMNLMSTLPWTSLLQLAQAPQTAPVVRRHAERRLQQRLPKLTLGEKIALARRAHRPLFRGLIESGDPQILIALLDNSRIVENDIQVVLNSSQPPQEFFGEVLKHRRWGQSLEIRSSLACNKNAPLPLALSALVELGPMQLRRIAERPGVPESVREAALALSEREPRD